MDNVVTNNDGGSTGSHWSKLGENVTAPTITEIINEESNEVTTVVIFVISAVLVIILIFLMAIFIDCRQQKLQNVKIRKIRRGAKQKVQQVFPNLATNPKSDDRQAIVNNMHGIDPISDLP